MSHVLLAVDTSGKNGGLALARVAPEQSEIVVLEVVPLAGGAFSAQLVPQIAALLRRHGYGKSDLQVFAVASGPGSFTGLRVGLAAIKALGETLQKPIAAISLLEAVASSGVARGRILAVLDAGRGDVYVGDYEIDPHRHANLQSERLVSGTEFQAEGMLSASERKTIVTPDAALAAAFRTAFRTSGIPVELIEYPNSAAIARIGWEHLRRGCTVRPEDLEANYIRQSDAEIFSKPAP
jgi:tRNA threonylcarbamoyladenosine biosynthesis protein TsaB